MKWITVAVLIVFLLAFSLPAIEIEHLKEITLSQNDETFIQKAGSLIVTEDQAVLIFDYKAGNMKIYDLNGKLVKIFGGKGLGPNEFVRPYFGSYNKPYVVFADFGRKLVFVYKKTGRDTFEFAHKYFCLGMGTDFKLIDDEKLMIAGYKLDEDRKEYHLYQYDYKNDNYEFILPTETSYGFNSLKQFKKKYMETLMYIGLNQFFDWSVDNIYFVWTGDIRVLKIDRKTKKITSFGKKTENYFPPFLTPEIRRAYDQRNINLLYRLREGMSYVKDIFVLNSNKVCVVYVGPTKSNKGTNVLLQFYTGIGEFVKEFEVLNARAPHHYDLNFYFNKDKNLFYIMDIETTKEFDQIYYLHEYRIKE